MCNVQTSNTIYSSLQFSMYDIFFFSLPAAINFNGNAIAGINPIVNSGNSVESPTDGKIVQVDRVEENANTDLISKNQIQERLQLVESSEFFKN